MSDDLRAESTRARGQRLREWARFMDSLQSSTVPSPPPVVVRGDNRPDRPLRLNLDSAESPSPY